MNSFDLWDTLIADRHPRIPAGDPMPLVSCLMPTADRPQFIEQALECWHKQDYDNLELIVLDDGETSIQDLLPKDPRIRYHRVEGFHPHGWKMNRCCELANGKFLIVWDDDDLYPAYRISRQINPMLSNPSIRVTGTSRLYYHDEKQAWEYTGDGNWIGGIAFRKEDWRNRRFDDALKHGADYKWLQNISKHCWLDLKDPTLIVATIHPGNRATKRTDVSAYYRPVSLEKLSEVPEQTTV